MKKVGIIGGIGPESTIAYYRMIIREFQETHETHDYPEVLIQSINMTEMLGHVFSNQLEHLVSFLKERIHILEKAGADVVALASNTPHLVFDLLQSTVNVPLISIVEETCKEVNGQELTTVGLLGTRPTMSMGFYQSVGAKHDLKIITPDEITQRQVHDKYMNELVHNIIDTKTKEMLLQVIRDLQRKGGIEGVILGGTELPLILSQDDFQDLRVFDTALIHVKSIVSAMTEGET